MNKETKTKAAGTPATSKIETYDLSNSADTMHLAVDVAKFIKENNLYQNIQGKEFVNVEGWQYAGSRLGIYPVIQEVSPRYKSGSEEIIYEARATLLNTKSGQTVGAGMAVCSNKENGKKYYQEFAIASMAQTRAIGKAYRNMLAWVIRAAGYEPTPAEEMDYSGNTHEVKVSGTAPTPAVTETKATQAKAETKPTPAPEANTANEAPAEDQEQPQIKYASAKQKEEIIRLLNSVVITRQEKTKMLLNINKLDEERAAQSIQKLRKVIEEREAQSENFGEGIAPNPENAPMSEIFRKELYDLSKELGGPANAQKTREAIIQGFSKMAAALDYKAELKAALAAKI